MHMTAGEVSELVGGRVEGNPTVLLTGAEVDSRLLRPGDLFVALAGARRDGHDFVGDALGTAAAALVHSEAELSSPSADHALIRVEEPLKAYHALASQERARHNWQVVAITGSVGKTTTKDFLTAILSAHRRTGSTAGNRNSTLGLPAQILNQPEGLELFVAEAGMSHSGELDVLGGILRPDVVVYTRLAPVHIEFFADMDELADAKAELLQHLVPSGTLVVNADDPAQAAFADRTSARSVGYGAGADARIENLENLGLRGSRFELLLGGDPATVELALPGCHQAENLLAAATGAWVLGLSAAQIADTASRLQAADHRGRLFDIPPGVTLVDDSYNASPLAVAVMIDLMRATNGRKVAVLGEMYELGERASEAHRDAGSRVASACDVLIAVGGELAGELAASALAGGMAAASVRHLSDAESAADELVSVLEAGDVVLVKGSRGVGLDRLVERFVAERAV